MKDGLDYLQHGNLADAEARLGELVQDRQRLQSELSKAIEEADADAMIRKQRALDEVSVRIYAQRARIMRLSKAEELRQRELAINERDGLEVELAEATKQYADAVSVADEKRVAMQLIQAKLFSLDSRIESQRQSIGDSTKELREHVARWRDNAIKAASETDACAV